MNGYPPTLIDKIWRKINTVTVPISRPREWVKLPHVKDQRVRQQITKNLLDNNLGVVFSGGRNLKSFLPSLYPSIPPLDQRNVVYDIPLEAPSSCVYTGQTGRSLKIRLNEHANDLRRGNTASSLTTHCINTGSTPDFARTRIITRGYSKRERLLKESITRSLHYERSISKTHPMTLRPPARNFAGIYASHLP